MSRASAAQNLRVGLFLAFGLLLAGVAIFAVGEKSGLFEGKTTLYVYFGDISGLVEGAPVRLAGLDVGTVSKIAFPADIKQQQARVTLSIKDRFMARIRADSVAVIDSKGLLGDKIVNLTLGSASQPQVPAGGTLKTRAAPSIEHLATNIEEAIASITKVAKSASDAIEGLGSEQVRNDVGRIAASTANILDQIERGPGFAHRALYDPKYGQQVEGLLLDARTAISRLGDAAQRIDHTVAAVQNGDGFAHELVYGETGKATMQQLHDAAEELSSVVHQIRDGDGLLHNLIFDQDNGRMVAELDQAATRLNHIMGEIEKGRGTIGGLVIDPSVYEELKSILGNVERNVLLKALIRFTIKENGIARPAHLQVREVPQAQPSASGAQAQTP